MNVRWPTRRGNPKEHLMSIDSLPRTRGPLPTGGGSRGGGTVRALIRNAVLATFVITTAAVIGPAWVSRKFGTQFATGDLAWPDFAAAIGGFLLGSAVVFGVLWLTSRMGGALSRRRSR
jgi:hypothetical protein